MAFHNPGCMGHYDFDSIARYARKRFIEGYNTVELMLQAKSLREKEEIALVAMMDLDDTSVENLRLYCRHAGECQVTNCRKVIKKLIEDDISS